METYSCSRFKSIKTPKPTGFDSLYMILVEIKIGVYQKQIEEIRAQENPSKSPLKDRLPLFTPTGIFNYRSMAGLESYNGIICLDIDSVEDPESLKSVCKTISWVYSAFVTPSGKGLKVIVKTDATPETYKEVEISVSNKFAELTGFSRDNHCKDIARVQFVSYDPQIYINENSTKFTF